MAIFEVKTLREAERFYSALGTNGRISGHHDTGKGIVEFENAFVKDVRQVGTGMNAHWVVILGD